MRGFLSGFCCCLALIVALSLFGCAVNPVTGQQQLMLLSEQDEATMGRATDESVSDQYGVYADDRLQNYLQVIGQPMGQNSHRPGLNWQFKVMDTPVVNAFAAPGGYIYVTRGLLAAVNNEAELAGVLGHEIGHVTARHSAQQYSKMMLTNLGLRFGQTLLGSYGDMLSPILEAGAGLLFLKFSRDDERQADALGVEYATRAGYDAGRMADFFTTLQRQTGGDGKQTARLPDFFSTHPNPEDRENTVRNMAANWQSRFPGQAFRVNREAFLRQVDGLVYGVDPRLGFEEKGWYYLPQYRVKLPIPDGWTLSREGNNLQLNHPEGQGVILVSIRPGSSTDKVVAAFLKSTGAAVHSQETMTTGDMPTRRLVSVVSDGQQSAVVLSHVYQRGGDVFAFHGLASESNYQRLVEQLQRPATGFAAMTDPARLNRQPQRIVVKTLTHTGVLEKVLQTMQVKQELWPKIAWLNGLQLTDIASAGEQIKLID